MSEFLAIERTPLPADVEAAATASLAALVAMHAARRQRDHEKSMALLTAEIDGAPRAKRRALEADRAALEAVAGALEILRADPRAAAVVRLEKLLALVGGPLQRLEIHTDRVEVQAIIQRNGPQRVIMAVLPQAMSRMRLVMQHIEKPGPERVPLVVPCYGEIGHAYIQDALDRVDFADLFLLGIGYLHDNLRVAA